MMKVLDNPAVESVLRLCPPHLYIRFCSGDFLTGTTVRIMAVMVEGECIDCEAFAEGDLPKTADPDPIMNRWLR